jgi:uncharacterized membrane protein YfcA
MSAAACGALAALALAASALSAVTGVAGGVILLSGLLVVVPTTAVVPLHGAVQLSACGARIASFRRHIRWDVAARFVAGLIPGSFLGLLLVAWLVTISPSVLKALIATAILLSLLAPKKRKKNGESEAPTGHEPAVDARRHGVLFVTMGAIVGALGILVGSTGPIVTQTLLSTGVVKEEHVATKSAIQGFAHFLKLPLFGLALSFDYGEYALPLALMIAAVVCGTFIGKRLLAKLSTDRFVFLARALLFLVAVQILVAEAAQALAAS